jgi:hypothetical protein
MAGVRGRTWPVEPGAGKKGHAIPRPARNAPGAQNMRRVRPSGLTRLAGAPRTAGLAGRPDPGTGPSSHGRGQRQDVARPARRRQERPRHSAPRPQRSWRDRGDARTEAKPGAQEARRVRPSGLTRLAGAPRNAGLAGRPDPRTGRTSHGRVRGRTGPVEPGAGKKGHATPRPARNAPGAQDMRRVRPSGLTRLAGAPRTAGRAGRPDPRTGPSSHGRGQRRDVARRARRRQERPRHSSPRPQRSWRAGHARGQTIRSDPPCQRSANCGSGRKARPWNRPVEPWPGSEAGRGPSGQAPARRATPFPAPPPTFLARRTCAGSDHPV